MKKAILAVLSMAVLIGCGGSSNSNANKTFTNMAGTWTVTTQSTKFSGINYTGTAVITDAGPGTVTQGPWPTLPSTGDSLGGSYTLPAGQCFSSAIILGAASGQQVYLLTQAFPVSVELSGTANANFNQASGTYSTIQGACMNGDFGNWQAVRN